MPYDLHINYPRHGIRARSFQTGMGDILARRPFGGIPPMHLVHPDNRFFFGKSDIGSWLPGYSAPADPAYDEDDEDRATNTVVAQSRMHG